MPDLTSIAGQVAIVTGGTAGIGLACAERFAEEGTKVALIARTADTGEAVARRLNDSGTEAIFVAGDCVSSEDMRAAARSILAKWGRTDILVNCAGGFLASPAFTDLDDDTWHTVIDWNQNKAGGTGFVFDSYEVSGLLDALQRALDIFPRAEEMQTIMRRAMTKDFSWSQSASRYLEIYRQARTRRRAVNSGAPGSAGD